MNLSIVITTFNSERCIEDCLDSIFNSLINCNEYEIILFDNNSTDNTVEIINEIKNPKLKLIINQSNSGYSVAVNKAVSFCNYENILLLNPDTVVLRNAISQLLRKISTQNVGAISPKLINKDGTFQLSSKRHFPTFWILLTYLLRLNKLFPKSKIFGQYNYTFVDENLNIDVDSVSGACMIFKKDVYELVEGFDERFFMYFEDTDFCIKLKSKGYRIIYYPEAQVIHYNNYLENYYSKNFYFYESLEKFIYKYRRKIYFSFLVYFIAKIIRHLSNIKRIIYFNYNYKINNG